MKQKKTVHFSVDDTIWTFWDLNENHYKSAFDQPVLKMFKHLNEKYGCKVTFYCFMEQDWLSLSCITERYKNEFEQNSYWCKFGFHASNEHRKYASDDYYAVKSDYEFLIRELKRIVGNSIDHCCRLHCYSMRKDVLKAFSRSGLKAILSPENSAHSDLGLSEHQMDRLCKHGVYKDWWSNITYIKTDIRLETCECLSQELFNVQEKNHLELYTHEWALKDSDVYEKMIICCELLGQLGYTGRFQQER